jgi:methionyl-tRNA formyltransferase
MNIVFLGSGEFGIECLNAILESSHKLSLIVTQPSHPAGRGKKVQPTPVGQWAKLHGIKCIETENINSPKTLAEIKLYNPDIIVVIAFGQKIGNELINMAPKGMINVHGSVLPKYRGAAPINWAIVKGETKSGITVLGVVEKMDAGDILEIAETDIGPDETAGELHDRLAKLSPPSLIKALNDIETGKAKYIPQDVSKVTLAKKLHKSDGFIDFNEDAETLRRKILGFYPWPGTCANYIPKKFDKVTRVTLVVVHVVPTDNPKGLPVGTLDENLNIICGKDSLRIVKIKPANSALMDFTSFINGRGTLPGDRFERIEQ